MALDDTPKEWWGGEEPSNSRPLTGEENSKLLVLLAGAQSIGLSVSGVTAGQALSIVASAADIPLDGIQHAMAGEVFCVRAHLHSTMDYPEGMKP